MRSHGHAVLAGLTLLLAAPGLACTSGAGRAERSGSTGGQAGQVTYVNDLGHSIDWGLADPAFPDAFAVEEAAPGESFTMTWNGVLPNNLLIVSTRYVSAICLPRPSAPPSAPIKLSSATQVACNWASGLPTR